MIDRLVDQAAGVIAIQHIQRAVPVAGRAPQLQHRLTGPARGRTVGSRFLRAGLRGPDVATPPCFDEQAVQADKLGVGPARHGTERFVGGRTIAGKLRGLRREQQRQRLGGGDPARLGGELAGNAQIAGADSDQPFGNGLIAAHAAPVANEALQQIWRVDNRTDQ